MAARLSPEEKAAREAAREAEKAQKAAEREARRQEREAKAAERKAAAEAKLREKQERLERARGEYVGLPAIQRRGEQPRHISVVDAFVQLVTLANSGEVVGVDVESTGYPLGHKLFDVRTIQLGSDQFAIVLDAQDADHRRIASTVLASAKALTAHNAAADIAPLAYIGVTDHDAAWAKMVDTSILANLADPKLTGKDKGLKSLGPNVLGEASLVAKTDAGRKEYFTAARWKENVNQTDPPERSGWAQCDYRCATMIAYAATDVLEGVALYKALPRPDEKVLAFEREVCQAVSRLPYRGMRLDRARIEEKIAELTPQQEAAAAKLAAKGIANPGSPKQLLKFFASIDATLPPDFKTGRPSTAKNSLKDMLAAGTESAEALEAAEHILAWRKVTKTLQTLHRWLDLCNQGDGRVRTTIYTLGTRTGRMSSVRENLQQVPKKGGIRQCIQADDGYVLVSADFKSLEVATAAVCSGDEVLKRLVREGLDMHSEVAKLVYGREPTDEERSGIKPGTFAKMFGGGPKTMARNMKCSVERALYIAQKMDELAPTYARWTRWMSRQVEQGVSMYRAAVTGRIIHLPLDKPHAAGNTPVQGFGREVTALAAVRFWRSRFMRDPQAYTLLIHDEILAHVRKGDAAEAREELIRCMTMEIEGVPFTCSADYPSTHWPLPAESTNQSLEEVLEELYADEDDMYGDAA